LFGCSCYVKHISCICCCWTLGTIAKPHGGSNRSIWKSFKYKCTVYTDEKCERYSCPANEKYYENQLKVNKNGHCYQNKPEAKFHCYVTDPVGYKESYCHVSCQSVGKYKCKTISKGCKASIDEFFMLSKL
jgi:hypothetical protein